MEIISFFKHLAKLKRLKRTAWVREEIKDPESVADHSFSTAILAMILGPHLNLDTEKLVKMALIHDLGESVTGDIVTRRGKRVDRRKLKEKEKREREAIREILANLKDNQEYLMLFEELSRGKTKEAKFIRDLDKLETALQAFEYEESDRKNLEEIFVYAETFIKNPKLKKILKQIKALRVPPQVPLVTHPKGVSPVLMF